MRSNNLTVTASARSHATHTKANIYTQHTCILFVAYVNGRYSLRININSYLT